MEKIIGIENLSSFAYCNHKIIYVTVPGKDHCELPEDVYEEYDRGIIDSIHKAER